MIAIVQGTLGGGKTLRATREMLDHLARGLHVYTNVDFVFREMRNYCRRRYRVEIQRRQIIRLPDLEDVRSWADFIDWGTEEEPVLVVIDEAQCFWNARDWAETEKSQRTMLSFLRQSRKAGVNIWFVTQTAAGVDKQFRDTAEIIVNCRNMAKIQVPIVKWHLVGLFRYQVIQISHQAGVRDLFLSAEWWFAWGMNARIFRCYRTHAFLDGFMTELAKTKTRMSRLGLRRSTKLRRLCDWLAEGDRLERWACRKLRKIEARRMKKARTNHPRHDQTSSE